MSSFLGFIFSQKWYKYWGVCSRLETKLTLNSWKSCDIWFSWHRSSTSCFCAPFVHSRRELMTGTESNKAQTASLLQCKCFLNRGTGSGVDVTCSQIWAVAPTGTSHPHCRATLVSMSWSFYPENALPSWATIWESHILLFSSVMHSEPWGFSSVWKETDHSLKGMSLEKFGWPVIFRFNCFHRPALYANSKRRKSQNANHVSSDFLKCTDTAKQC